MTEIFEKQLMNAFSAAWSELAPLVLGNPSELSLISERELSGNEITSSLEVIQTYPSAFAAQCSGGLTGVLVCLFKQDDATEMEQLVLQNADDKGSRSTSIINSVLAATATSMAADVSSPITFGEAKALVFTASPARLAAVAGEKIWLQTLALSVGEQLNSQMILLYAPQASLEALLEANAAMAAAAAGAAQTNGQPDKGHTSLLSANRNLERLLDVELEVIVRFGHTQMPLREVVRLGVGSMIELNRQVEEPVELLVNNYLFARGTVVVVDGYYGVCITEIGQPDTTRLSLAKA